MFTSLFWKDAAERAINTVVQVVLGLLLVDGTNLANLDWQATGVAGLTAGVISVLKSIVAAQVSDDSVSPASLAKVD